MKKQHKKQQNDKWRLLHAFTLSDFEWPFVQVISWTIQNQTENVKQCLVLKWPLEQFLDHI